LSLPFKLALSAVKARRLLARFRPALVIGVGGYASFPVVAAAQRMGIPTLLHEANALPGVSNRLLARRASVVCVGPARAAAFFDAGRVVVTGTPVRATIAARDAVA